MLLNEETLNTNPTNHAGMQMPVGIEQGLRPREGSRIPQINLNTAPNLPQSAKYATSLVLACMPSKLQDMCGTCGNSAS